MNSSISLIDCSLSRPRTLHHRCDVNVLVAILEKVGIMIGTLYPHPKGNGGEKNQQRYDPHQARDDGQLGTEGFYL